MAARLLPLQSILHIFQPAQFAQRPLLSTPLIRRILSPSIPASPLTIPLAAFAGISDLLRDIWDGLLKAVPKKKTSHMKKRHRQMAGKALKDVTHLSKCSACGRLKRSHVLCPYCVEGTTDPMTSILEGLILTTNDSCTDVCEGEGARHTEVRTPRTEEKVYAQYC